MTTFFDCAARFVIEEVDQFKYVGSTQAKDGTSITEVEIRLSQAHSAMARLQTLLKNKAISFPTKIKLSKVTCLVNTALRM